MRTLVAAGIALCVVTIAVSGQAPPRAASAKVTLSAPITALAAFDGQVAAGLADGGIVLWNGRDAGPGARLKPHTSRVIALGVNAAREVLSVAEDGSLARSAAGTGAQPSTMRLDAGRHKLRAAAFSSDGARLATGGDRGELRIFHVASGSLERTIQGHRTELHVLAMRPGAPVLASASAEGDLRIWNIVTGRELWSTDLDLALAALDFNRRDGALASGGIGRRLTFHDPQSYQARNGLSLARPRMVAALAWSPDGARIALGDIDDESLSKGGIELIDVARRTVVAALDTGGTPATAVVFAADPLVVAAVGNDLRSWLMAPAR